MTTQIVSVDATTSKLQVGGVDSFQFKPNGVMESIASVNGGQLAGLRNRIINGGCQVSQRGSVAAVGGVYTYGGADRMCTSVNALSSGTIQQITGGVSAGVMGYSHAVQATTSGAGNVLFQQRIESLNTKALNSVTITIKCRVYQDTGSAVSTYLSVGKPTSTADTFSAQTDLATTTVVSVPSATLTTLSLTYTLGAAEASLGLYSTVNFVLAGAVTSKYFTVTDWQLEVGSTATIFEQRPYGMELALCEFYTRTVFAELGGGATPTAGRTYRQGHTWRMRSTPTALLINTDTNTNMNTPAWPILRSTGGSITTTNIAANDAAFVGQYLLVSEL